MQLIMNDWFKAARKKLCMHSDKYTFVRNGKTFSGTRCNPYKGPATAKQIAHKQKFKAAIVARDLIIADETLKEAWHKRWMTAKRKEQTQATTLNGYIMQMYFDEHVAEDGSYQA